MEDEMNISPKLPTIEEFKDSITEMWSTSQQMEISYEESEELKEFVVNLFLSSN